MHWLDNAIIEGSENCAGCGNRYTLNRYRRKDDCGDVDCELISTFDFYATIQPAGSDSLNEIERTKLGERVSGMIVVHYYPLLGLHTAQEGNGIYVRLSDSNFVINGFYAGIDNGCADKIEYQGQTWKAVKTSCVHGCCHDDPGLDWVCRAYFCLESCVDKADESIMNPHDGIYVPESM